ncbi:MAG: ParB N-terminal domain-containing protein [Amphiplicatus sp.]
MRASQRFSSRVCSVTSSDGTSVGLGRAQVMALAARIKAMRRQGLADSVIAAELRLARGGVKTLLIVAGKLGAETGPPPNPEAPPGVKPSGPAPRAARSTKAGPRETAPAGFDKNRAALEKILPLKIEGGSLAAAGKRPFLAEIAISQLRVETAYQRVIGRRGRNNIAAIVRDFRWSRLSPLIVAPIEGTGEPALYAIIDGQHRATALATLGLARAPCIVHEIDSAARADAFAAVNIAVTAMTPQARFYARAGAGEPAALAVQRLCKKHGVEILAYGAAKKHLKARQCVAAGALVAAYERHGGAVFAAALALITGRAGYQAGDLDANAIHCASAALAADRRLMKRLEAATEAAGGFEFSAERDRANADAAAAGKSGRALLAERFGAFLKGALGLSERKAA